MFEYFMYCYGSEIVTLIVTAVFGTVGFAVKKLITDKRKEDIARTAARCVEQVWKTIHGPEKMEMALQYAETLLAKKGIKFDAEEMSILIESAVAEFNEAFKKE